MATCGTALVRCRGSVISRAVVSRKGKGEWGKGLGCLACCLRERGVYRGRWAWHKRYQNVPILAQYIGNAKETCVPHLETFWHASIFSFLAPALKTKLRSSRSYWAKSDEGLYRLEVCAISRKCKRMMRRTFNRHRQTALLLASQRSLQTTGCG